LIRVARLLKAKTRLGKNSHTCEDGKGPEKFKTVGLSDCFEFWSAVILVSGRSIKLGKRSQGLHLLHWRAFEVHEYVCMPAALHLQHPVNAYNSAN